ncbi:MAG: hypothetical protein GKS05_07460 [Nitrospirales bacterium]|nr:hypothetical protein [Nitrospirales bacterium]
MLRSKSNTTCNRYTAWLRHLLNREIKLGTITTNPPAQLIHLSEQEAPIYQYTPQQEHTLYACLG